MPYLVKFSGEIDISDFYIKTDEQARKEADYLLGQINGGFWGTVFENVKIEKIEEYENQDL